VTLELVEPKDEIESVSWSEIKTFQRCPKQHDYKYLQRLVPKKKSRPLFLGSWIHAALQTLYTDGDWKIGSKVFEDEWDKLFDEEKLALRTRGRQVSPPLPDIVKRIMQSYIWYNRNTTWKVIAVEQEFLVPTPLVIDGKVQWLKGIIDLIVEDEDGAWWVIDHKTAGTIPEPTSFHAMDPQLMLYPWAAKEAWKWDIAGIIYNYVKSKPPSIPQVNKDGSLSKRKVVTDYPTLYRFLKAEGYDPADFKHLLVPLSKRSPFLRQYRYPREVTVTREILLDALSVTKHIRTDKRRSRTITRECATMCSYHELCRAELNGMNTDMMRKTMFTLKESSTVGDRPDSSYDDYEEPTD